MPLSVTDKEHQRVRIFVNRTARGAIISTNHHQLIKSVWERNIVPIHTSRHLRPVLLGPLLSLASALHMHASPLSFVMPHLNLDVLCTVCDFITDVPDVLAFSLTCSTLRSPAIRRRLGMRPVTIIDATSINNFHDFIFVDKAARGPHVHAITIPQEAGPLLQGFPEELLRRLLAILSAATCVRTLSLYLPSRSSSSLLAHPLIVPAVARLTGIEELTLVSSFERANALLRCIRSPLKVFRYGSIYRDLSALRNATFLRSSLRPYALHSRMAMRQEMDEELTIDGVPRQLSRTLCDLELPQLYLPRRVVSQLQPGPFLAVRSFVLRDITELVRLDVLLHILPNIDGTLVLEESPLFYKAVRDMQRVEAIREANRFAQERHAWKRLDQVVAISPMLFALGLTCPIRHLILDLTAERVPPSASSDAFTSHALGWVLRDHTPTHLTIRGLRLPAGLVHLDDLFSADWTPAQITHLVVDAHYDCVDGSGKILWPEDVLETLLARLQYAGLTNVRIVMTGIIREADPFSASVHHGIRDLSLERHATQLQYAVPTLCHVSLTSRGATALQSDKELQEAWNVTRTWTVPSASAAAASLFQGLENLEEMGFIDAREELTGEDIQIMNAMEY